MKKNILLSLDNIPFKSEESLMTLQPLRFKNAQDLHHFISRLEKSGYIKIDIKNEGQAILASSPENAKNLGKKFLRPMMVTFIFGMM